MPHLNIQYTANLDSVTDMNALCQTLAATLVAPHFAVADGQPDRAFVYLNLRIMPGRSEALKKRAGDAVLASASAHLETVFAGHAIGLTLHIDEGAPAYEGKRNNLAAHLEPAQG